VEKKPSEKETAAERNSRIEKNNPAETEDEEDNYPFAPDREDDEDGD